jgi:hypothetical protein
LGLNLPLLWIPRLTPWATFLSRFAACAVAALSRRFGAYAQAALFRRRA